MPTTIHEAGKTGKVDCFGSPQLNLTPPLTESPTDAEVQALRLSAMQAGAARACEDFFRRPLERTFEMPEPERMQFINSVYGDEPILLAEYYWRLAMVTQSPFDSDTPQIFGKQQGVTPVEKSLSKRIAIAQLNELQKESEEGDEAVGIHVGALAFLRAMWSLLWTAFRHPLRTSYIDIATGEVVEPADDDEI